MLKILKNIDRKHYSVLGLLLFSIIALSYQRLECVLAVIFLVSSSIFAGIFIYVSQKIFHNSLAAIFAGTITRLILAAVIILPFLKTANLNTTLLIISFAIAFLLSKYIEILLMRRISGLAFAKIQESKVC